MHGWRVVGERRNVSTTSCRGCLTRGLVSPGIGPRDTMAGGEKVKLFKRTGTSNVL